MRPATTAVQNFLAAWGPETQAQIFDLYTFTLIGGEVLRFSGAQGPIDAPAPGTDTPLFTWPLGPGFSRTKTKTQVGTQVDELDIDIYAGAGDTVGSTTLTWQEAGKIGVFDGAYCELDRVFISPPGTVIGTVVWFYGRVGDMDIGRTTIKMKVKSLLDLLTNPMPRRLYQSACTWLFGKPGCDYDRVAGKNALGVSTGYGQVTITCQAGSNQNYLNTTFVPGIVGSYDQGTMIGLAGANAGLTRTIGTIAGGQIQYLIPWIYPVVPGVDTFNLLPGCDHTEATCLGTFNNLSRFGGFPFIPPPETAI